MAVTSQTNRPRAAFGITQLLLIATVLLLGGLAAIPLSAVKIGRLSSAVTAGSNYLWITLALWALEVVVFFALPRLLARRVMPGFVLGFAIRLFTSLIMAFMLSARSNHSAMFFFANINGDMWLLRLLAIATTGVALVVIFRGLFGGERRRTAQPEAGAKSSDPSGKFSFRSTRVETATPVSIPKRPGTSAGGHRSLSPPEGYTPVPAKDDISGMVNIPVEVICESIPDAEPYLKADSPVRIRLAWVVPQMPFSTVWLTWQQIFISGAEDPNYMHGPERPDEKFQGQWIQIPAKYYVSQVPREHFKTATPVTPDWLKRPPVPQEQQFEVK